MEKIMRNAPSIAVLIALVIQVERVKDFGERIGAGMLALVFAVFLASTIYSLSYWDGRLDYKVTASEDDKRAYSQQVRMSRTFAQAREKARTWLFLFIIIDGALNLSETMASMPAGVSMWETAGAVVYGIFPTLAAFGLGSLQAVLDKIPTAPSKKSIFSKLGDKLLARFDSSPQVAGKDDKALAQGDKQEIDLAGKDDKALAQGDKQENDLAGKDDKALAQGDKQEVDLAGKEEMTDTALLAYWSKKPQASDGEVARHFGRSRQAVQQRRRALTVRGAFFPTTVEIKETITS